MNYQAHASQDKFVANLFSFKTEGTYLDIGSCHAISANNTYCFDEVGWKGICIEIDPVHNDSYTGRTCKHINADATKLDYTKILEENNMPEVIDYLSLDIDALSTTVLGLLPLDKYKFKIITIEHDFYIHQGIYRDAQREILTKAGYTLVCADVLVPIQHDTHPDCSFEDWWIHPDTIAGSMSPEMVSRVTCSKKYPMDIIAKL